MPVIQASEQYPPGTIGIMTGELQRYGLFTQALLSLQVPKGTKLVWCTGPDLCQNMNNMVSKLEGEWLWILGDDHFFESDILLRLLKHDVDIVVPICPRRIPPFDPVWFQYSDKMQNKLQDETLGSVAGQEGLRVLEAAGTAGMLVKKHVFEKLGSPWFVPDADTPGIVCEDLAFCKRVNKLGYKVLGDITTALGHITSTAITLQAQEDGSINVVMQFWRGWELELSE